MLFNSLEKTYQAKVILLNSKWKELYNYDMWRIKKQKNFVEEDFIELRDSVEELISVIEKYKDMRYNSSTYIDDLKEFLADIKLTLKEKKITDKELKNLNSLGESYFDSRIDNSIYSYKREYNSERRRKL